MSLIKVFAFLALVLLIEKCNCKARQVWKHEEHASSDNSYVEDSEYYPTREDYNPKHTDPNYSKPCDNDYVYNPPPRNVSDGAEVVAANNAKFLVRLFSQCGDSEYTKTVCMGVIIGMDTVITAAHCIYGQKEFGVCMRKENDTKCPGSFDATDFDNCLVTKDIYIHPDFVGSLLKGSLCHNIAVLKWNTNVFRPDQVYTIDFNDCTFDFREVDEIATIVGCGNQIDTDLVYFVNQIKGREVGLREYGDKYLQCPAIYTVNNTQQKEVPCTGYAGAPLFLLKTKGNVPYDPNLDKQLEFVRLYGLGSFSGRDCAVPSGFVALCDYKLFLTFPTTYGIHVTNANQELEGFPLDAVINILQTLLLDGARLSCTLERVLRLLSSITGIALETLLENIVFEKLLFTLLI